MLFVGTSTSNALVFLSGRYRQTSTMCCVFELDFELVFELDFELVFELVFEFVFELVCMCVCVCVCVSVCVCVCVCWYVRSVYLCVHFLFPWWNLSPLKIVAFIILSVFLRFIQRRRRR